MLTIKMDIALIHEHRIFAPTVDSRQKRKRFSGTILKALLFSTYVDYFPKVE